MMDSITDTAHTHVENDILVQYDFLNSPAVGQCDKKSILDPDFIYFFPLKNLFSEINLTVVDKVIIV